MKNNQLQSGSAHLAILLLLVVALLSSLGFIAYQNFFQKTKDNDSTKVEKTTKNDDSSTTPIIDADAFNIKEWGLTGSYISDYAMHYNVSMGGNQVGFYPNNESCPDTSLGGIVRAKENQKMSEVFAWMDDDGRTIKSEYPVGGDGDGKAYKRFGDYVYIHISAQSACVNRQTSVTDTDFDDAVGAFRLYFRSLEVM